MRIVIDTNGDWRDTIITINGDQMLPPENELREFHLSVHAMKKVKLQMSKKRLSDGKEKIEFISYYGDDFKKYDEFNPAKKEN